MLVSFETDIETHEGESIYQRCALEAIHMRSFHHEPIPPMKPHSNYETVHNTFGKR